MTAPLREGFTTGTAAAAAAKAAVTLLLGGPALTTASVLLPPFITQPLPGGGLRVVQSPEAAPACLNIALEKNALCTHEEAGTAGFDPVFSQTDSQVAPPFFRNTPGDALNGVPPSLPLPVPGISAWAAVLKDGGDDPDATHGARIVVFAGTAPFLHKVEPAATPVKPGATEHPPPSVTLPVPVFGFSHSITLYGGAGVGIVTLPGLPVPVGEPAINPEPRLQIAAAACEAAGALGYTGPLHILIAVPQGEARAKHTLNARLGILGGISILGTRGTVRPYSHESWQAAILQSLSVAEALGLNEILFSTGRRSERALFRMYPHLAAPAGVQAADFAAFSLRRAAIKPFTRIAWGCFPGKLLKLAQGLEWTHAKAARSDIPLLASLCREAGASPELAAAVAAMPTAVGAFALMKDTAQALHDAVLERLARKAYAVMCGWMREEHHRVNPPTPLPEVCLHVFSMEGEHMLTVGTNKPALPLSRG